jgi:DNA-binding transcriptional MerR regulator
MSPAASLTRIGPFARLAGVTIKTLRYYDSAGIFQPMWVHPSSGYRFYCTTQLPMLRRIRVLRDMGCSIAELRALAHAPGGLMNLQSTGGLRRRLMVRAAIAELQLRQLDSLLDEIGSPANAPVVSRQIASTPALTIRDCVRSAGNDIHRMFESAERLAARRGARTSQSPFLLLHDMEYGNPHTDVEVCVPVSPESLGTSGVRLIESAHAACVHFAGGYEQAPWLFDATMDGLRGTGARIAGPIREVYLRFGADQRGYKLDPRFLADDVSQYRTELQVPLLP